MLLATRTQAKSVPPELVLPLSISQRPHVSNGKLWINPGTGPEAIRAYLGVSGHRLLRGDTEVEGRFEPALKEILLEMGIRTHYEPLRFGTGDPERYEHLPDFVTSLSVDGKVVIIETHSKAATSYKGKLKRFMELHGRGVYSIVIDSRLALNSEPVINLNPLSGDSPFNGGSAKYADEDWRMPGIRHERTVVDFEIVERVNASDRERWKSMVKAALVTFIEERADRFVPDAELVSALRKAS